MGKIQKLAEKREGTKFLLNKVNELRDVHLNPTHVISLVDNKTVMRGIFQLTRITELNILKIKLENYLELEQAKLISPFTTHISLLRNFYVSHQILRLNFVGIEENMRLLERYFVRIEEIDRRFKKMRETVCIKHTEVLSSSDNKAILAEDLDGRKEVVINLKESVDEFEREQQFVETEAARLSKAVELPENPCDDDIMINTGASIV